MSHSTYIIAEIAQGHEGSKTLCRHFVDVAKKSGADAIKFQIFDTNELCTPDNQDYKLFQAFELEEKDWKELIEYAVSKGIDFLADIFGLHTLKWIANTKTKGFKIHSSDIKNLSLLKAVKKVNQKIYLSAGGSELQEIKKALKIIERKDVVLLTGFQSFPNILGDIELDKIEFLKKKFGISIGYADHIDPKNSLLAITIPVLAVMRGAEFIEKHLTIDRENLKLEDYGSALNPTEFLDMVQIIRSIEKFSHTGDNYILSERERGYRKYSKKVPVAGQDIKKGEVIAGEDIFLLRVGNPPKEILDIDFVAGKKAVVDIAKLSPLTKENIK